MLLILRHDGAASCSPPRRFVCLPQAGSECRAKDFFRSLLSRIDDAVGRDRSRDLQGILGFSHRLFGLCSLVGL